MEKYDEGSVIPGNVPNCPTQSECEVEKDNCSETWCFHCL